ncbi:MAG: SecD/SecF fusion protein, partial [Acetobacteraceae bacterium]|nr:SecD/SecF fusion protein [Acetobacteraceae bacterium]
MMYFSRLKATLILGVCLLGMLLGVPNLFPTPAAWVPWRTVHLGLDLRGGSYLLLEVDMKAVLKERLDSLADAVRQALRPGQIFYQALDAQPDQNRVVLRLRDATKTDAAVAAMRPLISQDATTGQPYMAVDYNSDGTVTLTLSAPALAARAAGAVDQSIEIVRRRIDETGVVDPQITRQGQSRIVVQLPGVGDPNRIKQLIGKTAHMTFRLVDETANPTGGGLPPPGDDYLQMQDRPGEKIAVRKRIDVDGADLTDARAGTSPETGDWVVNFTFNSVGARRFADISRANVNHR